MGVGIHGLWLFMATVLLLNAMPGVDRVLATRNTLRHGLAARLALTENP